MNCDALNPTAIPVPNPGLPYYRMAVNVSGADPARLYGNTDLGIAFRAYDPVIDRLRSYGADIMLVVTHQTSGEGRYNWNQMTSDQWSQWTSEVANVTGHIAAHYRGKVRWYQAGNEHDLKSEASVYLPPAIYALLFHKVADAIRRNDPAAKVLTAGMASGAPGGSQYLRQSGVLSACDGVAFHCYGQDTYRNDRFGQFGTISEFLRVVTALGKPVHITEWGALDHENVTAVEDVASYAKRMMAAFQGKVETAMWFAWGRQHNGYAVSPSPGIVREPLLTALRGTPKPDDNGSSPVTDSGLRLTNIPGRLNLRQSPSLSGSILMTLVNGDVITVANETATANGYRWRRVSRGGIDGWIACEGKGLRIGVQL